MNPSTPAVKRLLAVLVRACSCVPDDQPPEGLPTAGVLRDLVFAAKAELDAQRRRRWAHSQLLLRLAKDTTTHGVYASDPLVGGLPAEGDNMTTPVTKDAGCIEWRGLKLFPTFPTAETSPRCLCWERRRLDGVLFYVMHWGEMDPKPWVAHVSITYGKNTLSVSSDQEGHDTAEAAMQACDEQCARLAEKLRRGIP